MLVSKVGIMLSKANSHILQKYLRLGIRNKVPFTSVVSRFACTALMEACHAGEWVNIKRRIGKKKVENDSDGSYTRYNRLSRCSWCTRVVTLKHEDGMTPGPSIALFRNT